MFHQTNSPPRKRKIKIWNKIFKRRTIQEEYLKKITSREVA